MASLVVSICLLCLELFPLFLDKLCSVNTIIFLLESWEGMGESVPPPISVFCIGDEAMIYATDIIVD